MEKLIITAAITGAEVTRNDNPSLPVTPEEIARDAREVRRAGASILHLHVRDEQGRPTQRIDIFRECIDRIRTETDIVIQISTGGALGASEDKRIAPLQLGVEMATLTTGSVNFGDDVFLNRPVFIRRLASEMKQRGIKPEIEVFDTGMIATALKLCSEGLLRTPLHFDFVMGVPGGIPGDPRHLFHLMSSIPPDSTWSVAGIGRHELPLAVMAIIMGGHVRVGFEDNIYYRKGVLAESNAQLVARIARLAQELGRDVATPDEARKILGIGQGGLPHVQNKAG